MIRLKSLLIETTGATPENLKQAAVVVNGLIKRGFSQLESIALAGNMSVESAEGGVWFDTNATDGLAFGLMQWQGPRRTALEAYAKFKGMAKTDLSLQLDFVKFELKDGYLIYPDDSSKSIKDQTVPGIPTNLVFIVNKAGKPTKPRIFISGADTEVKKFNKSIRGTISDTTAALTANVFRPSTPHTDRRVANAIAISNYIKTGASPKQTDDNKKDVVVKETGKVHTVKSGDTLGAIAIKYNTTVDALIKKNPGLRPDNLQLGQKIKI